MLNLMNLFDDTFDGLMRPMRLDVVPSPKKMIRTIKVDVKDEGDNYLIHAELPGYTKDEVSVELENGYLNITAAKNKEVSEEKDGYIHKESYHGTVSRSMYVGEGVKAEDIKASLNDGVLKLTVPKKEDAKPASNRIAIE